MVSRITSIARAAAFVFFPLFAVACGATSTPRIRVARDLGCSAEQTAVARLDQYRWEVTGCGRTAIYTCTYPVRDCWREGEIRAIGGTPAPAPPPTSSD